LPQAIVALGLMASSLSAIVINKTLSASAECDDLAMQFRFECAENPAKRRRSATIARWT
jgi:hypothetical protein